MKTDIDNTFIRYGRLHLTKQEGFESDSFRSASFHAPPAHYGFYAMPIRFQELFLIGSLNKTQPDVLSLSKEYREKYSEEYLKKRYKSIIHKFVVKNDDVIWHHLNIKPNKILASHGSWNKSLVRDWKKALIKESVKLRVETLGDYGEGFTFQQIPKKTGYYSKDHFEVFFDTKVY